MSFTLEDLHSHDVVQTAKLWEQGWRDAHIDIVPKGLAVLRTEQSFLERLTTDMGNTRVGRNQSDILGFCTVHGNEIYQMYVGTAARGTGLAQALMQDGEARMRAVGHKMAWLACAIGNDRAARFYDKSGWTNAGIETVDLDTKNGAFAMQIWKFEKRLAEVIR